LGREGGFGGVDGLISSKLESIWLEDLLGVGDAWDYLLTDSCTQVDRSAEVEGVVPVKFGLGTFELEKVVIDNLESLR
jgi:hypothetical protein